MNQLRAYEGLLRTVNRNVNLVSRGELEQLWDHHILHCLALAIKQVPSGSTVVDWGTGGGLPAIPLAIVWTDARIVAVDGNSKKTRSVAHFCRQLGLANCVAVHVRAEAYSGTTLYSVSRATAPLSMLWTWHQRVAVPWTGEPIPDMCWAPGLLCLKGGDLEGEYRELRDAFPDLEVTSFPISDHLSDPYFAGKVLIHVRDPHAPSR